MLFRELGALKMVPKCMDIAIVIYATTPNLKISWNFNNYETTIVLVRVIVITNRQAAIA